MKAIVASTDEKSVAIADAQDAADFIFRTTQLRVDAKTMDTDTLVELCVAIARTMAEDAMAESGEEVAS